MISQFRIFLFSAVLISIFPTLKSDAAVLQNSRVNLRTMHHGFSVDQDRCLNKSFIYNFQTNGWETSGDLNFPRCGSTATQLSDGRILVTGGYNSSPGHVGETLSSAEIYDLGTHLWHLTAPMHNSREDARAVRLSNGSVLVAGGLTHDRGSSVQNAEIYNPEKNIWTETGPIAPDWEDFQLVALQDGRVLAVGGDDAPSLKTWGQPVDRAMLWDPQTGLWTLTASLYSARNYHQALLLSSGEVWVGGGSDSMFVDSIIASTEIFNPKTNTWRSGPEMHSKRANFCALSLGGEEVNAMGGIGGNGWNTLKQALDDGVFGWANTEYSSSEKRGFSNLLKLSDRRIDSRCVMLPNQQQFIAGGYFWSASDDGSATVTEPDHGDVIKADIATPTGKFPLANYSLDLLVQVPDGALAIGGSADNVAQRKLADQNVEVK